MKKAKTSPKVPLPTLCILSPKKSFEMLLNQHLFYCFYFVPVKICKFIGCELNFLQRLLYGNTHDFIFAILYSQLGDWKMLEDNLEVDLGNLYSNSYIVYIGIY